MEKYSFSLPGTQAVAGISGDCLHKVIRDQHVLRRPPAIAFDAAIIAEAARRGVRTVSVLNADSGRSYAVTLADFQRYGIRFNRGWGDQLALELKYWAIDGAPPQALRQAEIAASKAPGWVQGGFEL